MPIPKFTRLSSHELTAALPGVLRHAEPMQAGSEYATSNTVTEVAKDAKKYAAETKMAAHARTMRGPNRSVRAPATIETSGAKTLLSELPKETSVDDGLPR